LKPVRSVLIQEYGPEVGLRHLDALILQFPYQLPRTRPDIDSLIAVKVGEIYQQKPKELARIGVGYKDKGSLSGTGGIEASDILDFTEHGLVFDSLVRQIKNRFSSLFGKKTVT
jgi:hypothetical protein